MIKFSTSIVSMFFLKNLFTSEDVTIDVIKLALDSIISKYIQRMHSNSTVKYLPDNFMCRNCAVADSLEFQMLYELLI